jgi:SH3-like domain-containing protein
MKWAPVALGLILLAGGLAAAEGPREVKISRFSGKPVPRFETLRYAAVNGRAGPSKDHPIVWRYEMKGLPVLIIKESEEWRRVRDPSGDEVWIHARMLQAEAGVLVRDELALRESASKDAKPVARLGAGVLGQLKQCVQRWCEIEAGGHAGWAEQHRLWGADTSETGL